MQSMGTALMGTGEAEGEHRALRAAEIAISNPLLDEVSMRDAKGLLISITGSFDMTLYEVEEAASRVRREVDPEANPDINIIVGATFDHSIEGRIRVSVVATGINAGLQPHVAKAAEAAAKSSRLMERVATPAIRDEREKPKARANDNPPESWQGSGNVTIEPRSPKYPVSNASARGGKAPVPQTPHFEPQPPAKPLRPPRRPLTGKDFPELAQHEADMQGERDLGLKRRGGLLDWVTGRKGAEDAPRAERPMPSFDSDTHAARNPRETGPLQSTEPHDEDGHEGRVRDIKGTGRGRNGDEPFEIPNFFKRPLN
jgi:cell division protein FtsZ